jgi:hypothetical protein
MGTATTEGVILALDVKDADFLAIDLDQTSRIRREIPHPSDNDVFGFHPTSHTEYIQLHTLSTFQC